jgi:drug/metabolite transporter (DMT)-like permease
MNKKLLFGILLVTLGACSYGVLATFVKLAYNEGFTTNEITSSQYFIGWVVLGLAVLFLKDKKQPKTKAKKKSVLQLVLAGTSLGLTGLFYYLSVKNIPVSIAIVLLMQSTWLGVLAEAIIKRQVPSLKKIIVSLVICGATILAAGLYDGNTKFDFVGYLFGFLAAISYTVTIISSAHIALDTHWLHRSFWLSTGGTLVVLLVTFVQWDSTYNTAIFYEWGLILAFFGTILPPLLFAYGMPYTGIGLGTILGAIELPVSVIFASLLLHEEVAAVRWIGISIILMAILVMNINFSKKTKKE